MTPDANQESMAKYNSDIQDTKRKKKKRKSNKSGNSRTMVFVFLSFAAGVALILYPWFSNLWNEGHQSSAIMNYEEGVDDLDNEIYDNMITAAEAYNERLAYEALYNGYFFRSDDSLMRLAGDYNQDGATDSGADEAEDAANSDDEVSSESENDYDNDPEYVSLLNYDESGMMGYISVPCIDLELPIYHGTSESVLQSGVGHIAGSSLPVGGESSHCVLSGHRGLPSSKLFTDLDQVQIGNIFELTILNETYTYQVYKIEVIDPTDFSLLQIEEGKDLCTLVTCTPYGINTRRLLVMGERVPNGTADLASEDQSENHGEDYEPIEDSELRMISFTERLRSIGPYLAGAAIVIFAIFILISQIRFNRERKLIDSQKKRDQIKNDISDHTDH